MLHRCVQFFSHFLAKGVAFNERVRIEGKTPVSSIEKPGFCPQYERSHSRIQHFLLDEAVIKKQRHVIPGFPFSLYRKVSFSNTPFEDGYLTLNNHLFCICCNITQIIQFVNKMLLPFQSCFTSTACFAARKKNPKQQNSASLNNR